MSNGNYRSKHINTLEGKEGKFSNSDSLIIAADVAKKTFYAALTTPEESVDQIVHWDHPWETRKFVRLMNQSGAGSIQLVMEPTSTYQDPLRYIAYEEGWEVWKISPNRVHNAAEVYDGVPSQHDPKACHLIAWLHKQNLSERWWPEELGTRRLKILTSWLAELEKRFQRLEGQLEAKMAKYWPEISSGWNVTSATMLELLAKYGGPDEIVKDPKKSAREMKRTGGHFLKPSRINQVIKWAKQTVGVPMLKEEREMLSQLAEDANRIRCRQNEIKSRIRHLIHKKPEYEDVLRLAEEVGFSTAAVLRVKIGDFREYNSADELVKALGLNLKEKSSGAYKGRLKITKRGSSAARRYLYLATLRKIISCPIFEAWHKKKVKREGGKKKGKSIIALMRKYAGGLWYVPRGNKFDSRKLFDLTKLDIKKKIA